jgi:hypothetical protein
VTAANTLRDERDANTTEVGANGCGWNQWGTTAVTGRFDPRSVLDKQFYTVPCLPNQRCAARFDRTFALTGVPAAVDTLYQQTNAHFTTASLLLGDRSTPTRCCTGHSTGSVRHRRDPDGAAFG